MEEKKAASQKLVKHKEKQSVIEFATILEKMAKKLKEEGKFTFVQGTEHIEVSPASKLKVEYEYEVKGDKHEFEIEFEWTTGEDDVKSMDIE
jgi:amphi-Trp domain-containing protein